MRRLLLAIVPGMAFFATVSAAKAANPDHVQRLLKTNQCPSCDLSNADLKETNLFGANLIKANLKGAILRGSNLGSANFTEADLSGANLEQAYLDRANLENANLTQANLTQAYLKNSTTRGVQLRGANLRGANLQSLDLVSANLQGADLTEANLSNTALSGVQSTQEDTSLLGLPYSTPAFSKLICQDPSAFSPIAADQLRRSGIEFSSANLSGANLTGATLTNAVLLRGNLSNANLTGANLKGACLVQANLKGAILDRADLQSALFKDAVLEGASLKDVRNADLSEAFKTAAEAEQRETTRQLIPQIRNMMQAQQFHLRHNQKFAATYEDLGKFLEVIPLREQPPEQFVYRVFSQGDRTRLSIVAAVPKTSGFKTYLGLISATPDRKRTFTRICVSQDAKPILPKLPLEVPANQPINCPTGFQAQDPRQID